MQESQFNGELDSEKIQNKAIQLREKFFLGHQKSQIRYKNGIVFIGNSRIGKSTLSSILAGIQMRKKLNGNTFVIQPLQERYRKDQNLIKHTFKSVTAYPNIRQIQIDGKYYTTVDLPGFMDTSYQKQICNWAYIKNILQQLQKIIFVMVLQVHSQNMTVQEDEIKMMKRFMQAFPTSDKVKPKQNLCMIVNFVENIETQEKQAKIKERISKELNKQLIGLNMFNFYSKAIEQNRLLVIQRARKDTNMSNNEAYTIPKLLPFIKSHINKLQKTQLSKHRIDLTKTNDKKGQQLRKIIKYFMQITLKNIAQRVQQYKRFISQMLSLLSQTQGVTCDKYHYGRLYDYQCKNKLSIYKQIQLPKQYTTDYKQLNKKNESQSVQQIIFEIIELFSKMNSNTQVNQTKEGLNNLLQKSMSFYRLVQKLGDKMFDRSSIKQFLLITQYFKKAIYVDYLDLVNLRENIDNFKIEEIDGMDETDFYHLFKDSLFQIYSDQIIRITSFKDSLKRYFEAILNKYNYVHISKVNIQTLKRLRQSCLTTNFKQLRLRTSILMFKISHKQILNPNVLINYQLLSLLQQSITNINKSSFLQDQLKQIQNWKKSSKQQQWECIKGKNYLFLLKLLTIIGYSNRKQLIKFYLQLNAEHQQVINLLKLIIEDVQTQNKSNTITKLQAYQLCLQAKQKMFKVWNIPGALKCCKLAQRLYLYDDKKKVIQARQQYMQLLKIVYVQDPVMIANDMDQYLITLNKQPWTVIKDEQYNNLLKIVQEYKASSIISMKSIVDFAHNLSHNRRSSILSSPQLSQHSHNSGSRNGMSSPQHNNMRQSVEMMRRGQKVSSFSQQRQKDMNLNKKSQSQYVHNNHKKVQQKPQPSQSSTSQQSLSQQPPKQQSQPQRKFRGFGGKK